MPYCDVPAFMEQLTGKDAMAARGLEYLILTASRSGEVLGATWDEVNFDDAIWTIPALRMKGGKVHRVPLSQRALTLLKALYATRISNCIFPGQKMNRPLSGMAFEMLMRRTKANAFTVHGFRSAFRDWVGDETQFSRDVAEQALAHRMGDATEQAYRRADALEKRRLLMEEWSRYCSLLASANVVKLHG
jgi:integrase